MRVKFAWPESNPQSRKRTLSHSCGKESSSQTISANASIRALLGRNSPYPNRFSSINLNVIIIMKLALVTRP